MYSHDSPPQQPEIPRYDAPFLPGANAAPPPMPIPPAQEKTTRSRPKTLPPFPVPPEVRTTKTPPTPRTSQRTPLPQKKRRGTRLWVKLLLVFVPILVLIIGGLAVYPLYSYFNHPARTVIHNFYQAMKEQHYENAYNLYAAQNGLRDQLYSTGNAINYKRAVDFAKACRNVDKQSGEGPITQFALTSFSTVNVLDDSVTAIVNVMRGGKSYTTHMGLVQEGKSWKIDYVDNLCSNLNPN